MFAEASVPVFIALHGSPQKLSSCGCVATEAAHQSLDRSRGGLGLSIVRSLVQLHGGSVSAHSDGRGRGSTFAVIDGYEVARRIRATPERARRRLRRPRRQADRHRPLDVDHRPARAGIPDRTRSSARP
jgi:hypothetical protein